MHFSSAPAILLNMMDLFLMCKIYYSLKNYKETQKIIQITRISVDSTKIGLKRRYKTNNLKI